MAYILCVFRSLICCCFTVCLSFVFPSLILFCPFTCLEGATLQAKTAKAFDEYIEKVEEELTARRNNNLPYLMVSESPGNMISLSQNLVVIRNLNEDDQTPKGIIHDWLGAVFLEGISLDETLEILVDYDSHPEIFEEILQARLISKTGNQLKSQIRFKKEGLLTVVTDSVNEAQVFRISKNKAQVFCRSVRINEIENPGTEREKVLPAGNDRGLLWRLNSYMTLEESENGVTIECRSVNLTRDLPFGIGIILGPFIKNLPPESIESMLTSLQSYVSGKNPPIPDKQGTEDFTKGTKQGTEDFTRITRDTISATDIKGTEDFSNAFDYPSSIRPNI